MNVRNVIPDYLEFLIFVTVNYLIPKDIFFIYFFIIYLNYDDQNILYLFYLIIDTVYDKNLIFFINT